MTEPNPQPILPIPPDNLPIQEQSDQENAKIQALQDRVDAQDGLIADLSAQIESLTTTVSQILAQIEQPKPAVLA